MRQELAQESEDGGILLGNANQPGGSAELAEGLHHRGAHLGRELDAAAGAATTGFASLGQGHLSDGACYQGKSMLGYAPLE
jgi:hypothetical protein